jgi:hypothetical protein
MDNVEERQVEMWNDMENMENAEENCQMIWKYRRKESRIVIRYGKYGRKISRIVKWFGEYGRKANRIVIRYGQYRGKVSQIVKT